MRTSFNVWKRQYLSSKRKKKKKQSRKKGRKVAEGKKKIIYLPF